MGGNEIANRGPDQAVVGGDPAVMAVKKLIDRLPGVVDAAGKIWGPVHLQPAGSALSRLSQSWRRFRQLPAMAGVYSSCLAGGLLMGNSGTGKTHLALALGLSACQRGHRVRFTTTAAMVHELLEARDEKRLLRYQRQMPGYELLIVDELGFVPLSKSGAELLFEVFSQRYERGSTLVTSNLPFQEWTEVLGSERLTGALLDRLTHHVHILEMNGESYRLKQSKRKRGSPPNS